MDDDRDHQFGPLIVPVPDSPDARLFLELSSYGSDLVEARHALELAAQGETADSALSEASRYLIEFAVVAYCRTVLRSNVRGRLTDHIDVPAGFVSVHEQIKVFRNATIAHSQSELAVTYPVAVLDATLAVTDVMAGTVVSSLPWQAVLEFRALVEAMLERLDEVIEPVRARLKESLGKVDGRSLRAGTPPTVIENVADEFNARTKRPPYPTSHTFYWSPGQAGDTDEPDCTP